MRYLVLGCGPKSMGEAIAARLLRENDSTVLVGDICIENENATIEKLNLLPTGAGSKILRADASRGYGFDVVQNKSRLHDIFMNYDIVINALPAQFSPLIVDEVLKANELRSDSPQKTHYCDLGGVLAITKEILSKKNQKRALRCGVSIVPECGLQPGTGNVHMMELYEKYFGTGISWLKAIVDSMTVYVCGLPKTSPYYKELFNLKGLEEIFYNAPLVLSNGKPRKIKKLSHYETMNSSRFGLYFGERGGVEMEAAVTGGLGMLPYYMKGYVNKLQEKTLRWSSVETPGHYELVQNTPRENFIEVIKKITARCPANEKDFSLLHIEAVGFCKNTEKKIKVARTLYVESDNDFNSMQKATGFTTAVIAKLIAEGRAKPGAHPPEIALDPAETVKAISKEIPVIQEFITHLK